MVYEDPSPQHAETLLDTTPMQGLRPQAAQDLIYMLEYISVSAMERIPTCDSGVLRVQ